MVKKLISISKLISFSAVIAEDIVAPSRTVPSGQHSRVRLVRWLGRLQRIAAPRAHAHCQRHRYVVGVLAWRGNLLPRHTVAGG